MFANYFGPANRPNYPQILFFTKQLLKHYEAHRVNHVNTVWGAIRMKYYTQTQTVIDFENP